MKRRGWNRWTVVLTIAVLLCGGIVFFSRTTTETTGASKARYVGRQTCQSCHQQQHEKFLQSHHHQAMAVASEQTVLANFDNQSLEHDGLTSHFLRRDDKFLVRTEGQDGAMTEFEVRFVLAYHPLQQYMVQVVEDRPPTNLKGDAQVANAGQDVIHPASVGGLAALQVLRLCWDVDQRRWFYLRPEDVPEKLDSTDPLHWTGVTQRWNTSCAACHSTNLKKRFDSRQATFGTTFSDIDVSCEACHGPGSHHVALAQAPWYSRDLTKDSGLVSLKSATAAEQVQLCASCHSRRRLLSEDFHETRQMGDHLLYEPMSPETYFVDGQIKDEVFEVGSYLQSKMYSKGIRCTDCHDPHTAKTYYPDNRLCTSCHQHPAGVYDSPQHHGHVGHGPGTRCVDCHMPTRHYMDVDPRRDHSIRIPRPDLSLTLGTPNACTGCHLDSKRLPDELALEVKRYQDWQRLAETGQIAVVQEIERVNRWAAETVATWRTRQGKPPWSNTFGESLQRIRSTAPHQHATEPAALEQLLEWANTSSNSPMYRVTAMAEVANWADEKTLQTALSLLDDADPFVVFQAMRRIDHEIQRVLEYGSYGMPPQQCEMQIQRLSEPLIERLSHPTRLIRTQAATLLLSVPPQWRQVWIGGQGPRFKAALDEALVVHLLNEELAAVAEIYQAMGQVERAEEFYRLALQHSPYVYGIRNNLAILLEQKPTVPTPESQDLIQKLRQQDMQLLQVEMDRAAHLPSAGHLHFRYAMAKYLTGEMPLVEKHLLAALERQPHEPTFLLAMATYWKANAKWSEARPYVEELLRLDPRHPGYLGLWQEVQSHTK